jgi:resuscitation-promoting factor RpfB
MPSNSSSASQPNTRRWRWLAVPIVLGLLSLLTAGYFITFTEATVSDGIQQSRKIRTHQRTVEAALREANVQLRPEDVVVPPLGTPLTHDMQIKIARARLVRVQTSDAEQRLVRTQRTTGRELLADLGYAIGINDLLSINGEFTNQLPDLSSQSSQPDKAILAEVNFRKAIPISVIEVGVNPVQKQTSARTVGEALMQAGYTVYLADRISPAIGTPIKPNLEIRIERAKPVSVVVDGRRIRTRTHNATVGEVLAEMNIVLYDQDYARPSLNSAINSETEVRVVRVTNAVEVKQDYVPFETKWEPDASLELDTQIVGQDGAPGVQEQRTLVTYEDGLEVRREVVADFTASDPQPKIYKYGTNIVVRTLDTPQGPVQYWRKIRMLATSYSSSTAGVSRSAAWYGKVRCGFDMRFGIVAVDPRVIPLRTNVYVPEYGVGNACDTGSAILGKRIDLGYDDNNLQLWYRWTDVYLLAPPPGNIDYILD